MTVKMLLHFYRPIDKLPEIKTIAFYNRLGMESSVLWDKQERWFKDSMQQEVYVALKNVFFTWNSEDPNLEIKRVSDAKGLLVELDDDSPAIFRIDMADVSDIEIANYEKIIHVVKSA